MFVYQDWPGGVFASPALLGTRPGGAYAAAWAAMQHMGKSGYRNLARRTCKAFDQMRAGIGKLPELYVMGEPSGPLLAFGSRDRDVNIYAVGDQMDAKGWTINRLQNPDGLHAMITAQHDQVIAEYLRDLKEAVAVVKAHPELAQSGSAATYGMMSHIPLRGMVKQKVLDMFASMYKAGGAEVDLHHGAETAGPSASLVDRIAMWYVTRKQRSQR
jgi:glutamate/tyrosine decarboxylase-like PLP-dependent enzyme